MKTITFRPLRFNKKMGKIIVASYMQWRKVKTADYNKFNLVIDNEYKNMRSNEYVYNHEGEQLFFFTYNPNELPIFSYPFPFNFTDVLKIDGIYTIGNRSTYYTARGIDIDGVPTFTHHTANKVARDYRDMNQFEPLTVAMVVKWLGWFLYQLENSNLKIGK